MPTPSACGTVRRRPKLAPDAISIILFGPGVIDETSAKAESAARVVCSMARNLMRSARNGLQRWAAFGYYMQSMIKIDAISRNILQQLSRDGRISNLELAERVGLSPSACLRRVQELERSGVIKGY